MTRFLSVILARISIASRTYSSKSLKPPDAQSKLGKMLKQNRVTVISPDESISIMDLKDAESLSERRDLKLVKIEDANTTTRRPVYRLMTASEYHSEELKKRQDKKEKKEKSLLKGVKVFYLAPKIGEHDLMTQMKKMLKLLEKQYELSVNISGLDPEDHKKCEEIYHNIETSVKPSGKLVQKMRKGNGLKFQIVPVREFHTYARNFNKSSEDFKYSSKINDSQTL